ncbi:alpha-L-arabinofuranosidase C-terminal domain-containing protein [Danxiaibacter flavus]|uniref:non-reducing end alpha-L-arabinofuranosidase n=1 Tax=Danxiaibacter flavus TaxID=3049108 RepID=A0ABV3ZCJ8_9BACT|nr:alpha-L-arabinofuranosidase C-terminal domain-containing protein [Chitinophagaceae bacterium DXS]
MKKIATFLMACGLMHAHYSNAQDIVVQVHKPQAVIQPNMWGVFFEDINLAADGGLYAELVKNRSFEFNAPMMGWKELKKEGSSAASLVVNRSAVDDNNPRFIRVKINDEKDAYGLQNEGFRGMGIHQGEQYNFSVWANASAGKNMRLRLELINEQGKEIGNASLSLDGNKWKKYAVSFPSNATAEKAKLNVWIEGTGTLDLDMISLFPQHTWKERPGGLRADLVQLLADLKPGFIRFPGGCIVEGKELVNRYQWKKTVGNVEDRKLIINRWNNEFAHRSTPDYFQSFGLGFFEYFQLAEDIGARPLPILNCGMACQFNSAEVVAVEEIDPYIQDALDLIEFANGGTESKWGKLRADMGHPAPFNLQMMGVGNEQWGSQYVERYKLFAKAIKQKYPSIQLVNSVGPFPDGDLFNFLNDTLRSLHADILDEHYYRSPEWFLQQAKRYDSYDRNGPSIFAGEYAAHTKLTDEAIKKNNWQSALAEAAFMTGLERNADVVKMASYAPLFAHAEGWQWAPDLIWFNNLKSYGTPDYYVQKLYTNNVGTRVVPALMNNAVIGGADSLYASASINENSHELIIKIANVSAVKKTKNIVADGLKKLPKEISVTMLASDNVAGVNSFDQPENIKPAQVTVVPSKNLIPLKMKPYSFYVLRMKM